MRRKNCFKIIIAILALIAVTLMLNGSVWAQSTYKTLHVFKGGEDGAFPQASLVFDSTGSLYGTTAEGGGSCTPGWACGVVFKLTPDLNGDWKESLLYTFTGDVDGSVPIAPLIFDAGGNLYGTTEYGGCPGWNSCGTVFQLVPNANGSWTQTVLYAFGGGAGGHLPTGGLVFDKAGNLYGTTWYGGVPAGCGTVFELAPNPGGGWTESVIHAFTGCVNGNDGVAPRGELILDSAGNLYGITTFGGAGASASGTVFELVSNADGSWTEKMLHSFTGGRDGAYPFSGLIWDASESLYGTAEEGGAYGNGTLFKLAPTSNGSWTFQVLHQFTGGKDGANPFARLIFDAAGNLYGATSGGGAHGYGVVFKLTQTSSGGWKETVLHAFQDTPGADPYSGLILDALGNLYGITAGDSSKTSGSVFKITP